MAVGYRARIAAVKCSAEYNGPFVTPDANNTYSV